MATASRPWRHLEFVLLLTMISVSRIQGDSSLNQGWVKSWETKVEEAFQGRQAHQIAELYSPDCLSSERYACGHQESHTRTALQHRWEQMSNSVATYGLMREQPSRIQTEKGRIVQFGSVGLVVVGSIECEAHFFMLRPPCHGFIPPDVHAGPQWMSASVPGCRDF